MSIGTGFSRRVKHRRVAGLIRKYGIFGQWRRLSCANRQPFATEALEQRMMLSGYTLSTLASFNNTNGAQPESGLIMDSSGNLYGTTYEGGNLTVGDGGGPGTGGGTVFEIPKGSNTIDILAEFNGTDGANPTNLIEDGNGDLFGTTAYGGTGYSAGTLDSGYGTVFEIAKGSNTITTLADFAGSNGFSPDDLVIDTSGNLFGTVSRRNHNGAIFEIANGTDTITTVALFRGTNGAEPDSLIIDGSGNLYGTTAAGGSTYVSGMTDSGDGTIFEIASGSNTITTLASFDGINAEGPVSLVMDSLGNLFGATVLGGDLTVDTGYDGAGTIFELANGSNSIVILAKFEGTNGISPTSGMIVDSSGNLYGTTTAGGIGYNADTTISGIGTVFELANGSNTITNPAEFGGTNGDDAMGGVILDSSGNLYGTTEFGGPGYTGGANPGGYGTVFELIPTVGAGTHLVFTRQPKNVRAGITITPPITVAVEDANGNVVTSDNSIVTLGIFTGPAGAGIGGTLTATVIDGVATFSNITLTTPGSYTLAVRDGILTGAATASFTVPPPGYIDTANMNVISGWAYDPTNPAASINVEVVITGGPTQMFSADQTRSDLQSVIGSTNHGFTFTTPVLSVGNHTAYVYAVELNETRLLLATETLTSQNSLFDEHYYLATYPNVAAAVAAGEFASGYDHYIQYGQYEGYSPSPYWDEAWYLQENPDVAAAVKAGTVSSGFMQYYQYGQYENRGGLLYFNTSYYLQNNPDVVAAITAGTITSAFEHFVLYGQYEGRSPMKYFSSAVYDADNQDILPYVTGEPFSSDFEQFIEYGQYEDRIASNYYNEQIYLADNPDVAAAVEAGQYPDGFQQWLEYGQYEGRTAV